VIVVSDTSPLNYLVLINAIDVLPKLFREIHVPSTVMLELQHPRTPNVVKSWAQSPPAWLLISAPHATFPAAVSLDPGEAQALALAKELNAAAVLIDEKKGRRIAREQGFTTLGTITILELAAQRKLLDLKSALDFLQKTSFQITKNYIDAALERDAARKLAEMQRVELLTVLDSFEIKGRGVVLMPSFSIPRGWKDRIETVTIIKPDGDHYEASAQFNMTHFSLTDRTAPADERYRVAVMLPDNRKEEVPVGSKIMASQAARDAVLSRKLDSNL